MTKTPDCCCRSRLEIERLIHTYGELIDSGNLEGVARMFTHGRLIGPDGSLLAAGYDELLTLYRDVIRLYEPSMTPLTQHVMSNPVMDIDDDAGRATNRCCYTVFQKTGDGPLQPVIAGRYHDTFKCIDGVWHFETRQTQPTLFGDLSRHITHFPEQR